MIFTIPNAISAVRIALVPVFVWLVFGRDDPTSAGLLIGGIGATDWVDGYLARRLGQVSEVGKVLDPLADRLAVAAAVVAGWVSGALPWPIAVLIAIREVLVAIGATLLAVRAHAKLDVRYIGKLATFVLYFAIPSFFLYAGTGDAVWRWAGWGLAVPGLALYYVVAALYVGDLRRHLSEASVSSAHRPPPGDAG
ncbi:MAG TPA: CDP-alcohol phosphatidyltransferase family protein [Acidimicrobiia bacterium]